MLMSAVKLDHKLTQSEVGKLDFIKSEEILTLLIKAMSLAEGDERTALILVKQASTLLSPAATPDEKTKGRNQLLSGGLAAWQVTRLKVYIADNISSQITLDELAGIAKLSTSYFSTAFKVSFGISPHNYVIAQRVEYAKRLMRETETSLSEIALDCGLSDQAHLSRIFRRATGTTPSAWRRYNRGQAGSAKTAPAW